MSTDQSAKVQQCSTAAGE